MRLFAASTILPTLLLSAYPTASTADALCSPLRRFVESVQPHETRLVQFHTEWGRNFKDSDKPALYARRCSHGDYEPAMTVCSFLMEYGATEFSEINVKRAIQCLSPKTRFGYWSSLDSIALTLEHHPKQDHGATVHITFGEDREIGGMVLTIGVEGY